MVRLDPQRKMVTNVELSINVRQVFVHLLVAVVVAEETPNAGIGIAYVFEVDGAVSIAEGEVFVFAVEIAPFLGEADYIGSIDAFHLRIVDFLEVLAADAIFGTLLQGELTDAAEVGVGADTVIGNAQGHPNGSMMSRPFADDFHDPGLVGVADGEGLTAAIVTVFLNKFGHASYRFAGCGTTLQSQTHQREIVQQTFLVDEFQSSVKGRLHDGYLLFVHQADDIIGVFHLFHVPSFV